MVKKAKHDATKRKSSSVFSPSLLVRLAVLPLVLYAGLLLALTVEPVQRHMIFLHKARWPLFPKYDKPEAYGLSSNRVRNLYVTGENGIKLGVWHVLPESIGQAYPVEAVIPDQVFDNALRNSSHSTMLYLHGNAAMRMSGHRAHVARHVTAKNLDLNFVILDYRGYADSTNLVPTEGGLVEDAKTVWDWLVQTKGASAGQIIVAGQSLGTGVAVQLVARSLAPSGAVPRALFLTAPFTSIRTLLLTYKLGKLVPVLRPLRHFGPLREWLLSSLKTHFDSLSVIEDVPCPILLIHSTGDTSIPSSHSHELFARLARAEQSEVPVSKSQGRFGRLQSFRRNSSAQANAPKSPLVVHLESAFGGHNDVGYSDTTLRIMKQVLENAF